MADPRPHPESWSVPQRTPLLAAGATLLVLVILLLIAGRIYTTRLRPQRQQPVTTFPAPGVEAFVHDGSADPHRPRPRTGPDPMIEAAKRAVVAEGLPGWSAQR